MLLFSLVLSMGLDMTLPEFQPDVDVSGNYIVSDYDVSGSDASGNDSFVSFVSPDTVVLNNVESNSDDDIVSVGTANMDRRSFSLNFETNIVVYDENFNKENRVLIEEDIKNSELLKENRNNLFSKILEKLVKLFAPII